MTIRGLKTLITSMIAGVALVGTSLADTVKVPYNAKKVSDVINQIEGGEIRGARYEPERNDSSYGAHQILTETAKALEKKYSDLPRITDYPSSSERVDSRKAEWNLARLYPETRIKIDGYTKDSEQLIKRVQKKHRLKQDGILDDKTYAAILQDRHVQERLCAPDINLVYAERLFRENFFRENADYALAAAEYNAGFTKLQNARLQQKLNQILEEKIPVDGFLGSETTRALIKFQAKYGLTADGKLGPKTRKALAGVWAKRFPGQDDLETALPESGVINDYATRFINLLEAD